MRTAPSSSLACLALLTALLLTACGRDAEPPSGSAPPSSSASLPPPAAKAPFKAPRIHLWRPTSEESSADSAAEAEPRTFFLRDGRRFEGRLIRETDRWLRIRTSSGTVSFPAAAVDRSEAARAAWARVRRFEKLGDPDLVKELELRWKERKEREARRGGATDAERRRMNELVQSRGIDDLVALAETLEGRDDGPWPWDRAAAVDLAAETWLSAARLVRERNFPVDLRRAAQFAAHACFLTGSDEAWEFAQRSLDSAFPEDPVHRIDDIRSLEDLEFYSRHITVKAPVWDREGADWPAGQAPPRKFRVHGLDGGIRIDSAPPSAVEGVAAVWKAEVKTFSDPTVIVIYENAGGYYSESTDPVWWKIFWNPVRGTWDEESPLPKLYRARASVHAHMDALRREERKIVGDAAKALHDWHSAMDEFAESIHRGTAHGPMTKEDGQRLLGEANAALDRSAEETHRSLQARIIMERGFDRLRDIKTRTLRALAGVDVPTADLADPEPMEVRGPKSDPETKELIYAALSAFEPNIRYKTVNGHALDLYAADPEIHEFLAELVRCPVAPTRERYEAADYLKQIGDPLGADLLENRIR